MYGILMLFHIFLGSIFDLRRAKQSSCVDRVDLTIHVVCFEIFKEARSLICTVHVCHGGCTVQILGGDRQQQKRCLTSCWRKGPEKRQARPQKSHSIQADLRQESTGNAVALKSLFQCLDVVSSQFSEPEDTLQATTPRVRACMSR
jgi:hypothetical protein